MASAVLEKRAKTLADVLHALGDIPLERIRFPVGSATEDDVIRLLDGDDKHICELIDGVLVEKALGFWESTIASVLVQHIWNYLDRHDLGIAFTADGPFRVQRGRIRFPDTGFVSWDRLPGRELPTAPILDAVPNLAVEVISKSNTPREMEIKLVDYFGAGVQLVWYIYPLQSMALIYTSVTKKKEIGIDGVLEGGKVLPGFRVPLKKLLTRTTPRSRRNGSSPRK